MGTERFAVLMVPILVALLSGLTETTGFHVAYKANERGAGIVSLDPWRQRASAALAGVTNAWRAWFVGFWTSRHLTVAAATLLLATAIAFPAHADALVGVAMVGQVAQLEADLRAQTEKASALLDKHTRAAEAHVEKVGDREIKGRLLTKEERAEVDQAFADARATKSRIDAHKGDAALRAELERMTAGLGTSRAEVAPDRKRGRIISAGEMFTSESGELGAWLKATKGRRSGRWDSPSVEVPTRDFYATTITTADTSAGDFIQPAYRPGVFELLYKPLRIRDLIAPGETESPIIKYVKETTFTNNAAMVAEGGTKPESALVYDIVTDEVEKCAHWIPVTEEALEDIPRMRSMIDARLKFGLQLVVDDQLLNGDGTSPNISGILDRVGLATAVAAGADTIPDAIHKQITAISTTAWMPPDGIVMHPNDWAEVARMKDTNGQYYGSGPFVQSQTPTLWGLPVAVTPTIVEGTGLVGAFRTAAQWFSKGGVRLDASNSHSDFFIKNLVAVRCEERLALAVYRPGAFGTVTGL